MKKLFIGVAFLGLLTACQNDDISNAATPEEGTANTESFAGKRTCPSEEIREEALRNNPSLMTRFKQNEQATDEFVKNAQFGKVLADGTVEIPVIVNVLYKTTAENVSDARIAEQIAVLNQDYTATNSDISKIPAEFTSVAAGDTKVKFRLAQVIRKKTSKTSWATNDAMKKASQGGLNATSPSNYLNMWVVGKMTSQGQTILGYATFPESAGLWNDGVVIAAPYFGKTGASAPFNGGRTATHEVGHYLNLRHIWGDGSGCATDYANDTPVQPGPNYSKPTYPLYGSCGGVNRSLMFMNYMDYVDDAAMFMFSADQKTRMQAVVASGGSRAGLRVL